jgi:hypothetical protein
MSFVEERYLHLISPRLRNFKQKDRTLFQFSCPSCGDSKKDARKARGYVYEVEGNLLYSCHNCHRTTNFPSLLKEVDPDLYKEFTLERWRDSKPFNQRQYDKQQHEKVIHDVSISDIDFPSPAVDPLSGLRHVDELQPDHPANRLLADRVIPRHRRGEFYHVDDFCGWANQKVPGKYPKAFVEPRLVIPVIGRDGTLTGFQGRSYQNDAKVRYMTVCLDKSLPFLFNLNNIQEDETIYALEGPFDSTFLPNAVASTGGVIQREVEKANLPKDKVVIVYDNECRNKQVVDNMRKAIEAGYKIVIWPDFWEEKDINDFVKKKPDLEIVVGQLIKSIVEKNTFSGNQAKLKLNQWKKC